MKEKLHSATRIIHTEHKDKTDGAPCVQGPVFASNFHIADMPADAVYQYGRFGHPTWDSLERRIANLEGGDVAVFPSGMAAIASVLTSVLKAGDTVLLPNDGYYPTLAYAETYLAKFGVAIKTVSTPEVAAYDFNGIQLIFLETPSNPLLDVFDISEICKQAHAAGALVAIDNTTATALSQTPLSLGADFSVSSDTKAMNGHSDVLFGHVACKDADLMASVRDWRRSSGAIPGPMETWLVERGMQTLDVRLERQVKNAQTIAEFLQKQPAVKMVRYPGLTDDPSHAIANQQMQNFGFIISFELESAETANCFLENAKLITNATSFGGVHTCAERRARWGVDAVPEGLIRLSAGIEHIDDLIADITFALDACGSYS